MKYVCVCVCTYADFYYYKDKNVRREKLNSSSIFQFYISILYFL